MFKNRLVKIAATILFLSSIVFIVFKVYSSRKTSSQPQTVDTTSVFVDLSWILPGKTTKTEILNKLGQPLKNTQTKNTETLFYNSTSKTRDNQITIEDEIVTFVKEMVSYGDPKKISDITSSYSISTYSLFGPDYAGGNKLYVYPDKGLAYLGDPKFDTLEEIWYFSPTSIENFKAIWAPNYSEKQVLNLY